MKCHFCQETLTPFLRDDVTFTSLLTCSNHVHVPTFSMHSTSKIKWFFFEFIIKNKKYQIYKFIDQDDDRYGKIEIWKDDFSISSVRIMKTLEDTDLTPDNAEQKLKTYLTFL